MTIAMQNSGGPRAELGLALTLDHLGEAGEAERNFRRQAWRAKSERRRNMVCFFSARIEARRA